MKPPLSLAGRLVAGPALENARDRPRPMAGPWSAMETSLSPTLPVPRLVFSAACPSLIRGRVSRRHIPGVIRPGRRALRCGSWLPRPSGPTPGAVSSRHILDVICSALPGEAITGPGTGRHGPFGRIDVLNSPNGRWCLSRACSPSARAALIIAGDHIDHALTAHPAGAEARGEDPAGQEGVAMQVPMTVQPPAAGPPRWVVRT
jgi:hypothetical protein